ncbi:MAG: hypothetical protein R3185_06250 [Candidatus Thermoplasmatota archaeon]|nr:hypothetical protein [Candidatus Thermoplasmatota archaeon]
MNLAYAASLSPELICELERAARWTGLPLRELELLGQDPEHARAFVDHVARGTHATFLDQVAWTSLENALHDQVAQREPMTPVPQPPQGFALG